MRFHARNEAILGCPATRASGSCAPESLDRKAPAPWSPMPSAPHAHSSLERPSSTAPARLRVREGRTLDCASWRTSDSFPHASQPNARGIAGCVHTTGHPLLTCSSLMLDIGRDGRAGKGARPRLRGGEHRHPSFSPGHRLTHGLCRVCSSRNERESPRQRNLRPFVNAHALEGNRHRMPTMPSHDGDADSPHLPAATGPRQP